MATSAADAISFLLARYFARSSVKRLIVRYPSVGAIEYAVTQGGWRMVALLRLSPTIPYSVSNYLYGLTGISFLPYWIASGVFTLPGTCVYVYLGHVGAEVLDGKSSSLTEWVVLGVGIISTILATAYLTTLARRVSPRAETS